MHAEHGGQAKDGRRQAALPLRRQGALPLGLGEAVVRRGRRGVGVLLDGALERRRLVEDLPPVLEVVDRESRDVDEAPAARRPRRRGQPCRAGDVDPPGVRQVGAQGGGAVDDHRLARRGPPGGVRVDEVPFHLGDVWRVQAVMVPAPAD